MNIQSNSLHLIDVENSTISPISIASDNQDLKNYLQDLLKKISSTGSKRKFIFERDTTEVKRTIDDMVRGENFITASATNAERLLQKEKEAQSAIEHLMYEIQKGVLVQALFEINSIKKLILAKADHTEYLDEEHFRNRKGFPIKKKVYKAFLVEFDGANAVTEIFVYDTNASIAKYWWSNFLELTEINTDEANTNKAFESIDKVVLSKIKSDHPADHNILRNRILGFFRSNDAFEMESFIENAIGDYEPVDNNLNIDTIKTKIRDLPEKKGFDTQFNIKKEVIKAKNLKSVVPINDKIDLHIKDYVDDIDQIIESYKRNGEKYIRIKTDSGYEAFKRPDQ